MLSDEQYAILRLARCTSVGPITFHTLIEKYGTAQKALKKIESSFKNIVIPSIATIEDELHSISKIGAILITSSDPRYPRILRTLKNCPPVITALGNINLLKKEKSIAIVGARNASYNGCNFVKEISYELAQKGFTIISGLAAGIDTAAHQIVNNSLPTIAIMASGINIVYPKQNHSLYRKIIETSGLVITEFPYGTQPKQQHFPQRNRIISGLSLGVLVVEAGIKSGSLITAKCALSQGREVFAVPGSPLDPRSRGSNALLKEGATLVESANDVINSLELMHEDKLYQINLFNSSSEELKSIKVDILSKLSYTPNHIEELIGSFNVNEFLAALSELELENKIEMDPSNMVSLKGRLKNIN